MKNPISYVLVARFLLFNQKEILTDIYFLYKTQF